MFSSFCYNLGKAAIFKCEPKPSVLFSPLRRSTGSPRVMASSAPTRTRRRPARWAGWPRSKTGPGSWYRLRRWQEESWWVQTLVISGSVCDHRQRPWRRPTPANNTMFPDISLDLDVDCFEVGVSIYQGKVGSDGPSEERKRPREKEGGSAEERVSWRTCSGWRISA